MTIEIAIGHRRSMPRRLRHSPRRPIDGAGGFLMGYTTGSPPKAARNVLASPAFLKQYRTGWRQAPKVTVARAWMIEGRRR
jgi:hypothetical protein